MSMSVNRLTLICYRHKTKAFTMFLVACFGAGAYFFLLGGSGLASLKEMQCSHKQSETMVKELCLLYKKGKIVGDMCHAMCDEGNIVFKKCLNYEGGKHVLLVDCINSCGAGQTVPAVLKTSHIQDRDMTKHLVKVDRDLFELFTYIKVFDENVHPIDYLINTKHLIYKVQERLYDEYGYLHGEDEDVLRRVWGEDHAKYREMNGDDTAYPINFVRTLWSLLAQSEYEMSVLFQQWRIFPKVYGFCGPLYLSEYAPSDERLNRHLNQYGGPMLLWQNRALTAVHILNLIHAAEGLQIPLQFCDVKTPHFGTNSDGEVRFTDSDTVFTNESLSVILKTTPCNQDKECAFFDCIGTCNVPVGICESYRTNSNAQTVCSKILQDKAGSVYEGVLANPPNSVASKIEGILNNCANGITGYRGKVIMKQPSKDLLKKLTNALLDSLDSS